MKAKFGFIRPGRFCLLVLVLFFAACSFIIGAQEASGGTGQKAVSIRSVIHSENPPPGLERETIAYRQERSGAQPEAVDPVLLLVDKTWDSTAGNWIVDLSWSSGTSPYTVSYSTDTSFQRGNKTLAMNTASTTLSVAANTSYSLECYSVTETGGVSPAVQGMGYDPYPEIPVPTIEANNLWWGDTVTLHGDYMDLIPAANSMAMFARTEKASSVTDGGNGFASSVSFTVPDDGRGTYTYVSTAGKYPSAVPPFLRLSPRNIPTYTNIRNIIYAPQTGHIWVSSDGKVDEIDLFQHEPEVVRSITSYTKPYISHATTTGKILVVDGVAGVTQIDQIDVSSGAVSLYANTTDTVNTPNFTRQILPVGIAATPDGTMGFVADAIGGSGASKVVRFPSNNGSAITDSWGNRSNWTFFDPCGMDVGLSGKLYIGWATGGGYIYWIPSTGTANYVKYSYTGTVTTINLDRDISNAAADNFWYSDEPFTQAFNQNQIEGFSARYLGASIYGLEGKIDVQQLYNYSVVGNAAKVVILNNAGQSYPYLNSYQVADRIVMMTVNGFGGVPIHLRMIDPADFSPYAPVGGWDATDPINRPAVPPYEANDNAVWASTETDFGLMTSQTGTPALEIDVTPSTSTYQATFYMKLPPRYSGDNWQVEVTRKNLSGSLVANQVCTYSAVFNGWKRVFVERDKMFRRGNLLDVDVSTPPADELYLLRWDGTSAETDPIYVQAGEQIVAFDKSHSYPEGAYEVATILSEPAPAFFDAPLPGGGTKSVLRVYLDRELNNEYCPSPLTFDSGESAAIGVVSDCDAASNQINASNSCFYEADMQEIENTFNDAYVQFVGLRSGMNAVPYLPQSWFDSAFGTQSCGLFSNIWFGNFLTDGGSPPKNTAHNYFHLIGGTRMTDTSSGAILGFAQSQYDYSYVLIKRIEDGWSDLGSRRDVNRSTTRHEKGHQFDVNANTCDRHDSNPAWCGGEITSECGTQQCLMNPMGNPNSKIQRFCSNCLLKGAPDSNSMTCGTSPNTYTISWTQGQGAIRTEVDSK